MRLILAGIVALGISVQSSYASEQTQQAQAKLCLFAAAERLPKIAGLKVTKATSSFAGKESFGTGGSPMNIYKGSIVVEAVGQVAMFMFSCPVMDTSSGGMIFDRGMTFGLTN